MPGLAEVHAAALRSGDARHVRLNGQSLIRTDPHDDPRPTAALAMGHRVIQLPVRFFFKGFNHY
jgi:hypothetical protein